MKYSLEVINRIRLQVVGSSLILNSVALATNTLLVSIAGYLFWWIAARLLSPVEVGISSGLILTSTLLADFSTMGFGYGIIGWYSGTPDRSRLVNAAMTLSGLSVTLIITLFVIGIYIWPSELQVIYEQKFLFLLFITSGIVLNLTTVQDQIFIGARQSRIVALKNGLSGMFRVLLLATFGWMSWIGSWQLLFVFVISLFIGIFLSFSRYFPRIIPHYQLYPIVQGLSRSFIRFSILNHIANMIQQVPLLLIPILVFNFFGAELSAYFFIAWYITQGMASIAASGANPLFAEGASNPDQTRSLFGTAIKYGLILSSIATIFLSIFAQVILKFFGDSYANQATTLIRLLALSIIPMVINSTLIANLRVQGYLKTIIISQMGLLFLTFSLGLILGQRAGLTGFGAAWLISQVVIVIGFSIIHLFYQSHPPYEHIPIDRM